MNYKGLRTANKNHGLIIHYWNALIKQFFILGNFKNQSFFSLNAVGLVKDVKIFPPSKVFGISSARLVSRSNKNSTELSGSLDPLNTVREGHYHPPLQMRKQGTQNRPRHLPVNSTKTGTQKSDSRAGALPSSLNAITASFKGQTVLLSHRIPAEETTVWTKLASTSSRYLPICRH